MASTVGVIQHLLSTVLPVLQGWQPRSNLGITVYQPKSAKNKSSSTDGLVLETRMIYVTVSGTEYSAVHEINLTNVNR
jgi:hypothetical protein